MARINLKNTIIALLDVLLAVYLIFAITSFSKPAKTAVVCKKCNIMIADENTNGFLKADDVTKILKNSKLMPVGKAFDGISTRAIEDKLKSMPFVKTAQCYKTQNDKVCISVRQRIPVVRVMADNGENYYVDTHGSLMPETRFVTDQIIATGNITRKYAQKTLARVANQIMKDKFWRNQVVQMNILADGSVEIVPRVGEHVIYLGQPVNIDKKLGRLRKFYLYGLNKAGWNKYNYISVEFDNQIICKRNKRK